MFSILKKGLTLYQQQIFRPVQIESICRRHFNMTENLKLVLKKAENIVGKGENAGLQHFLLSQKCFQKASFPGFKGWLSGKG